MSDLPVVYEAGEDRRLGLLEQPRHTLRFPWPVFGGRGDLIDAPAPVPRSAWHPCDLSRWCPLPEDQDGVGCCAASATETALTVSRRIAGLTDPRLSAGDLYRRVCGGVDRGSLPEDNLKELIEEGIATVNTIPYLEWRRDNPAAAAERAKYRGTEAWLCPTAGHVAAAVMGGFPVVIGYWHYSRDSVSADGWMIAPGGPRGGHAVCVVGLVLKGSEWGFKFLNSWTTSFGLNGYAILPESRVEEGCRTFQAWALRSGVQEPGDIPAPK